MAPQKTSRASALLLALLLPLFPSTTTAAAAAAAKKSACRPSTVPPGNWTNPVPEAICTPGEVPPSDGQFDGGVYKSPTGLFYWGINCNHDAAPEVLAGLGPDVTYPVQLDAGSRLYDCVVACEDQNRLGLDFNCFFVRFDAASAICDLFAGSQFGGWAFDEDKVPEDGVHLAAMFAE